MTGEFHVALVDSSGDVVGWLSPRRRLVNAAWEAGRFSRAEADDFARFARQRIRRGMEACTWRVVEVSEVALDHYAQVLAEAQGGAA